MIDTSIPEGEEDDGYVSRSKRRAERKDNQARLEKLANTLAKLPAQALAKLDLDEEIQREALAFGQIRKGSGLARQRKRVAGLLRTLDLDELEAALDKIKR